MGWCDVDFQVFLEIRHVLSNLRKPRITTQTAAPGAPVNCTEHDVVRRLDGGGKARGDDDTLQVGPTDDQCFAAQTEATCFVQKSESRSAGMFDVNDQGEFSNPSGRVAPWTLRETFTNVRIQHEGISRRQRAQAKAVRRSTRCVH